MREAVEMSRTASGTVGWRGTPARWWARLTVRTEEGATKRVWVDLERSDLKNTPEDKRAAKRLALKRAKSASKKKFVGVERAMAPKVTLEDLEDKWFDLLDGDVHLKSGTRTAYKSCWTANGKPRLGKHSVPSLTVPVLRAWVRELTGELSASSVRNNAIALTRFLSDARAEGWIALESNPMKHEDVRALLPTVQAPDPDAIVCWTRAECEKLLGVATLPHDRFGLYLVALLAGLRAGELRGLTFGHLALDAPIPHVRVRQQLLTMREAGETATTGTPKTRSSKRDVPLHPAALAWLTWWRDEGWTAHVGRPRTDEEPVFRAVDGEAGRPRDPNILRRDLRAAKLPEEFTAPDGARIPYTFHATRRTFSRMLGDNGVPPEMVGMLDGHAAKSVTERHYMGRSLEAMARAVATLTLALPERPGMSHRDPARPQESSRESSQAEEAESATGKKPEQFSAFPYEQPIELPQFRHL
jgi:integrase